MTPLRSLAFILSVLSRSVRGPDRRVVAGLLAVFVGLVAVYSVLFHVLMANEGRDHSWATGVYWTLTTMSTLGFGDITFESDAGRVFSIVVLVSGTVFLLILLPFSFIQFVFLPWMAARQRARAPRQLPEGTSGHVVLTRLGEMEEAFVRRAERSGIDYVVVVPHLDEALRLTDLGYQVMVGELDDPATYHACRVGDAALVALSAADTTNTNIAFTVREIDADVAIVATATSAASVDILELAGCDEVIQLGQRLGTAMAERVLGADARSHVIGAFGDLRIAEASMAQTPLVGSTLADAELRERFGCSAVALWDRGRFEVATAQSAISDSTTLVLAGTATQLAAYDEAFERASAGDALVVVIGGGRVGRAAAAALSAAGVEHRIIEQRPERVRDPERTVVGDAADIAVLAEAGIDRASAVLVTTHDDDVNIYLTLYCRRLRPEMQVIGRANRERNVTTLHRAGADAVLSYALIGATTLWNRLSRNDTLVLSEGLDVFRVPVPDSLEGRTLAEVKIRETTGCNVVAVVRDDGIEANPDPTVPLDGAAELVVIADDESEQQFLHDHGSSPTRRVRSRR